VNDGVTAPESQEITITVTDVSENTPPYAPDLADVVIDVAPSIPVVPPTPFLLSTYFNTTDQSSFESDQFTTTEGNVIVVVHSVAGENSGMVVNSATLGVDGRAQGSGTAMTLINTHHRGRINTQYYHLDIAPGDYTFQIDLALNARAVAFEVFEVKSFNGIGASTPPFNNSTDLISIDLTTTADGSTVMSSCTRAFVTADPIVWSGFDGAFNQGDTGGGNAFSDLDFRTSYKFSTDAGPVNSTANWTSDTNVSGLSIELLS